MKGVVVAAQYLNVVGIEAAGKELKASSSLASCAPASRREATGKELKGAQPDVPPAPPRLPEATGKELKEGGRREVHRTSAAPLEATGKELKAYEHFAGSQHQWWRKQLGKN